MPVMPISGVTVDVTNDSKRPAPAAMRNGCHGLLHT